MNSSCQFGYATMSLMTTTQSDVGEYTCLVKTDAGSVHSSCNLNVELKKEVISESHSQSLKMVEESHKVQQVIIYFTSILLL